MIGYLEPSLGARSRIDHRAVWGTGSALI